MVVDGETGVLVTPDKPAELAEAIRRVVTNPDLMSKFKDKGRIRVENYFSWDSIAKRTIELYQSIAGAHLEKFRNF